MDTAERHRQQQPAILDGDTARAAELAHDAIEADAMKASLGCGCGTDGRFIAALSSLRAAPS